MTGPTTFPVLLDGYADLPLDKIANVVTFLERTELPASAPAQLPGLTVRRVAEPTVPWFRALHRRIGEKWLWFSAIVAPDGHLAASITAPTVGILVVQKNNEDIGLAEIDYSQPGDAGIVTCGFVEEAIATGTAHCLMEHALAAAFRPGICRVWLHTCTFDHPSAAGFYLRAGFRAWKHALEVTDDPRLTGILPRGAAPHVPLIEPDR